MNKQHRHFFRLKLKWKSFPDTEQKLFDGYGYYDCECGKNAEEYRDENTFLSKIYA